MTLFQFSYREASVKLLGFLLGVAGLVLTLSIQAPQGLTAEAWHVVGITFLMAVWWMTGPVHISVTALVPLALFPLFGIMDFKIAAAPYAHPLIFLFFAGFIIAQALQRCLLHKRIALLIAYKVGTKPDTLILGFMIAVAFLSMWVSNTATTVMMLPVALSVLEIVSKDLKETSKQNIGAAMMIAIAYAASIGGVGTLVGTPPNAFLAAFLTADPYNYPISFVQWMLYAMPFVLIMIPLTWFIITRVLFKECICPHVQEQSEEGHQTVKQMLDALGQWSTAEIRVAIIFVLIALSWIFRPLLTELSLLQFLDDSTIGIIGALILFLIPAGTENKQYTAGEKLISWKDAEKIPWGVLILFGGGLSMASAISTTGVAEWIGQGLAYFESYPIVILMTVITITVLLLTEFTSNVATTAVFLPIITVIASLAGMPAHMLAIPAAMAASCAFMLPVATAPNAVVFGSGLISVPQMMRAGLFINLLSLLLIVLMGMFYMPFVFSI